LDYFAEIMFKKIWNGGTKQRRLDGVWNRWTGPLGLASFFLWLPFTTACRTLLPPLPPINLEEPGWTVHRGQAVWNMGQGKPEIAGEFLVATRSGTNTFVQFAKTPFPVVTARSMPNRWEVEFPPQNRRYAGRGVPPQRLIWLHLPRLLRGEPPPKNWSWHEESGNWRLENRSTGELLEGYLAK